MMRVVSFWSPADGNAPSMTDDTGLVCDLGSTVHPDRRGAARERVKALQPKPAGPLTLRLPVEARRD